MKAALLMGPLLTGEQAPCPPVFRDDDLHRHCRLERARRPCPPFRQKGKSPCPLWRRPELRRNQLILLATASAKTYMRWAATVPDAFRFSVKLPRAISHEGRLAS